MGFNVVPPDLAAWLVRSAVFETNKLPPGAVPASSVMSSQKLQTGFAFDFPETLFSAGTYFSVFFTYASFADYSSSYAPGAYDDIQHGGIELSGVYVSDWFGNPNSLAFLPIC